MDQDGRDNASALNNRGPQIRALVIRIMNNLEAEQNQGIFTSQSSEDVVTIGQSHGSEGEVFQQEHMVSAVSTRLINTIYPFELRDCILDNWELETFAENVDMSELQDDRWLEENVMHLSYVNDRGENYNESNRIRTLAENVILIRLMWDFGRDDRHPFSVQIIWSSKYNWSGLMERLQDDTYDFEFKHEIIMINIHMRDDVTDGMTIDGEEEDVTDAMMIDGYDDDVMIASNIVNGLPTVIISEDSGDALRCVICYESMSIGESPKQLPCKHLYHSDCILEWFKVQISCPICRDKSAYNYFVE